MKRLVSLVCALAACGDPPKKKSVDAPVAIDAAADSAADAPATVTGEVALVPAVPNLDVDILFLVDDSPSMLDKQTNVKAAFPSFTTALAGPSGVLPNLHIGVVTSDLGTKGALDASPGPTIGSGPGSCSGTGKAGNLQNTGTVVTGKYISDVAVNGNRQTNYTGTLSDAFSSLASVGAGGCGFEQSIEATHLALDNNAANTGFLRPSANLAIIYVTDEDDCSIDHSTILGTDTTTFGPLQSFRCTRFGITCSSGGTTTDEMNTVGNKDGCTSNDASPYLSHIADEISFFHTLKPDPRNIMIGAIAGNPTPVAVELRAPGGGTTAVPALAHSCTYTDAQSQLEVADPAVRIHQLVDAFPRSSFSSVCTNVATAMDDIAHQIAGMTGAPCLTRAIAQPASCHVFDERPNMTPVELPACSGGTPPCYTISADAAACPDLQHLRVDVTRTSAPPADTMVSVRCAL